MEMKELKPQLPFDIAECLESALAELRKLENDPHVCTNMGLWFEQGVRVDELGIRKSSDSPEVCTVCLAGAALRHAAETHGWLPELRNFSLARQTSNDAIRSTHPENLLAAGLLHEADSVRMMALDQWRRGNLAAGLSRLFLNFQTDKFGNLIAQRNDSTPAAEIDALAQRWRDEHIDLCYPGRATYMTCWPGYLVDVPREVNARWWLHMEMLPQAYRKTPEELRRAVEGPLRERYERPY